MISVTAYWSEDDAESTLILSDADWASITTGANQAHQSKGFYEGGGIRCRMGFLSFVLQHR